MITDVALLQGLVALAKVFGDGGTAYSVGGHFTCTEAEAIAELLLVAGFDEESAVWLKGHAHGDDQGDLHAVCRHCDALLHASDHGGPLWDENGAGKCPRSTTGLSHEPMWDPEES